MKIKKLIACLCAVVMSTSLAVLPAQAEEEPQTIEITKGRVFDGTAADKEYFDFYVNSGKTVTWHASTGIEGYTGYWGNVWEAGWNWAAVSKDDMPEETTLTTGIGLSTNNSYIYFNAEFSSLSNSIGDGALSVKNGYRFHVNTNGKKLVLAKYVNGTATEIGTYTNVVLPNPSKLTVKKEKIATGYKITFTGGGNSYEFTDTTDSVVTGGKAAICFNQQSPCLYGLTWTDKYVVEPLQVMTTASKYGADGDGYIDFKFNKALDENSISGITAYDATVADTTLSDDKTTVTVKVSDISDDVYSVIIPTSVVGEMAEGEALANEAVFTFNNAETSVIDVDAEELDGSVLYDDYRFSNSVTVAGTVDLQDDDAYIYYNCERTENGDITGSRAVINSNGTIALQTRATLDDEWTNVATSTDSVVADEVVTFNLTTSGTTVTFNVMTLNGAASISDTVAEDANGFAGIGLNAGDGIFDGVRITAAEADAYEKVDVIQTGGPFNGFSVYKQDQPVTFTIKLNKTADEISNPVLYVDDVEAAEFVYDEENDIWEAVLSDIGAGNHTAYAKIVDSFDTVYHIDSYSFCIGQGSFAPAGFANGTTPIENIDDAIDAGSVTASFDYDYATAAPTIIVCVYDEDGALIGINFATGENNVAKATIAVSRQAASVKAFMCESFVDSAPLSGYMELN